MMEQSSVIKVHLDNDDGDGGEAEEKARKEKMDCSHRVIEKRRRDRINNSLMQLSKLVPIEKFKQKHSSKLEKAEILEVTVHYLTQQQMKKEEYELPTESSFTHDRKIVENNEKNPKNDLFVFLRGFKQCIADATKFFHDVEELDVSEGRCYRLIQHLKKQIARYENKERDLANAVCGERVAIWDKDEVIETTNRVVSSESNVAKRENGDVDGGTVCKKIRTSGEGHGKTEQSANNAEASRSSDSTPTTSNSGNSPSIEPNSSSRNFMPFVFPNMPMFATMPCGGANAMPRFQTSPAQPFGYQYQQPPQYIPLAMPQLPVMGMNFMPNFGMMNSDQSQNGSLNPAVQNSLQMHPSMSGQPVPGMMPAGVPTAFFPSMYTNGIHANIMSMRPRDSGYESSEKSSSSKASGSETSPQSFSDDSCQSNG
ncbi:uncharacterized protein LOC124439552 isoform X2 [Xenia sp. Carnegie-2017]|uniref:uncharacterized protein LOC124439552 isoform X2 n=1 Tax=Xenia sp. Carnegie-2017 TaxID=2897299 RepID=UPI001F0384BC|nr:uncharacterized protein LOC124439552 isoform X2 [Xenia sp. Carnegie-2017]XP_046845763.1 uncharacterized protein LOC124439552 isoform X2 [Xenia sp. Carnegie-2017]